MIRELDVKCECIDDVSSMTQFECKNECDKDLVDEGFFCTGKGISSVIEGKLDLQYKPYLLTQADILPIHKFSPIYKWWCKTEICLCNHMSKHVVKYTIVFISKS